MNISSPMPQRRGISYPGNSSRDHSYLSFYHQEQNWEVTIEDLTIHALHREQMFRHMENMDVRGADLDTKIKRLRALEKKYNFDFIHQSENEEAILAQNEEAWRNDIVSHHVLKLLYADADLADQRFFVEQESRLFEARLRRLRGDKELRSILRRAGLKAEEFPRDNKEFMEIWNNMNLVHQSVGGKTLKEGKVYQVPFQSMIRNVQRREVYLKRGYAYITQDQFVSWLCGVFRAELRKQMESAKDHYKKILAEDERIKMFSTIREDLDDDDDGDMSNIGELTAGSLDYWAKEAFPLCMKMAHYHLTVDSRLGHNGRLQYGLFLKGSGLPLDEALIYFRQHFTRKITVEEFTKRYVYNIRYNYGMEGKRANFQPHSCQYIIMRSRNNPNPGRDPHGCPFRNWDDTKHRRLLGMEGLDSTDIEEIVSLTGDHPQRACIRHFMKRFPEADSSNMGTHPHRYYASARLHLQHTKLQGQSGKDGASGTSPLPTANTKLNSPSFRATSSPVPQINHGK